MYIVIVVYLYFSYDFVKVYDGDSNSAYMLGSLTGDVLPSDMVSTGSNIFINFVSDMLVKRIGFRIRYGTDLPIPRIPNSGKCPEGTVIGKDNTCCCRDDCCWNRCKWNVPPTSCLRNTPGCTWHKIAENYWTAVYPEGKIFYQCGLK